MNIYICFAILWQIKKYNYIFKKQNVYAANLFWQIKNAIKYFLKMSMLCIYFDVI